MKPSSWESGLVLRAGPHSAAGSTDQSARGWAGAAVSNRSGPLPRQEAPWAGRPDPLPHKQPPRSQGPFWEAALNSLWSLGGHHSNAVIDEQFHS